MRGHFARSTYRPPPALKLVSVALSLEMRDPASLAAEDAEKSSFGDGRIPHFPDRPTRPTPTASLRRITTPTFDPSRAGRDSPCGSWRCGSQGPHRFPALSGVVRTAEHLHVGEGEGPAFPSWSGRCGLRLGRGTCRLQRSSTDGCASPRRRARARWRRSHAVAVIYDHVWYWRSRLPDRKGSPCRVVARSRRLGSVLVEFEDGFRVVTSRYAVRLG
jgi:hypothetical protein